MFKLKISAGERKKIIVDESEKIMDILSKEQISIQGATVALTGRVLDTCELSSSFSDLGVQDGDEAILSVVVKADSALR